VYKRQGDITETLFALDQGDKIVGVDITSTYPAEQVKDLPHLGHVTQLNVEAVLQLQPDLIFVGESNKSQEAIQQLEKAGIKIQTVPSNYTLEQPLQLIDSISQLLNCSEKAVALKKSIQADYDQFEALKANVQNPKKVLFIYSRGKGSMMVGGKGTSADAIIQLAGAINAAETSEFQALSAEGLVQTQPEVFLLFESGLKSLGGPEGFLEVPGVAATPGGKQQRIITMDGLKLLGFTPRLGKALIELHQQIYAPNATLTAN